MNKMFKKAQEEMVGFALILIIVSIIILVFVSLTLTSPPSDEIQSTEVENFLQALLQHTTTCEDNLGYLPVQRLILKSKSGGNCLDERSFKEALEQEVEEITDNVWRIDKEGGYTLMITSEQETILEITKGNVSSNYKAASPVILPGVDISFKAYF